MSETREQYRERLAQILDAEYAEAFRTPEERSPWDMVRPEWKQKMGDMAEAVAAQVLRDVMDILEDAADENDRVLLPWSCITNFAREHGIALFAAERGINLTESEDTR